MKLSNFWTKLKQNWYKIVVNTPRLVLCPPTEEAALFSHNLNQQTNPPKTKFPALDLNPHPPNNQLPRIHKINPLTLKLRRISNQTQYQAKRAPLAPNKAKALHLTTANTSTAAQSIQNTPDERMTRVQMNTLLVDYYKEKAQNPYKLINEMVSLAKGMVTQSAAQAQAQSNGSNQSVV
jgi:hypothetical protein